MSSRATGSLRRRLILWLLGPTLLVSTVLVFDAYRGAREAADRAYDRVIAASVLAIADRVVTVGDRLDVDLPYVALEMLRTEAHDRVYYRIAGSGGELLTGYADLPLPPDGRLPEADDPIFYDAEYLGEAVRIGALAHPIAGASAGASFAVQVAQTRGQRDLLVRELATATAVRLIVLVVLIAIATWLGVRFGLEPLAHLQRVVRDRSPQDLRPLDVDVPREVRDLVTAIDGLMARLGRTLASMEQFISDAAHQLRTPLAALHTQVELALRESDPAALRQALQALQASTWRTSRLAVQLLNLARSTGDVPGGGDQLIELNALAAEVTRDIAPTALARDIDIGFEDDGRRCEVTGDLVLIQELVRNLVDNAVRYCPVGARVTVRISADVDAGRVRLEVEDDGPGIPPGERARVLERFYRGSGAEQQGSGLGLAIVREVAQRHGGSVVLDESDAGGLKVTVTLPAAGAGLRRST
jgi:two-component system sensor histidine kinase TctE